MTETRTIWIARCFAFFIMTLAIGRADTITVPQGAITLTDSVSPVGELFQYNYTIADGTGLLAVLDISVTPGIAISGLAAPGGPAAFATAYDSALGLVSFIENGAVFTSAPESGFIFSSSIAPSASAFAATLFDGTTGSGHVQAPVVAPEASSLALCAFGLVAILVWRKTRSLSPIKSHYPF
jgi:hypothetical protein